MVSARLERMVSNRSVKSYVHCYLYSIQTYMQYAHGLEWSELTQQVYQAAKCKGTNEEKLRVGESFKGKFSFITKAKSVNSSFPHACFCGL